MRRFTAAVLLLTLMIANVSCGSGSSRRNEGKIPRTPFLSPFKTTEEGKKVPLRFVVMADCRGSDKGVNTKAVEKTLEGIKKVTPQPLFAVMPGDLVSGARSYSETKAQLQHFKATVTKYYPMDFFYPGFGNHEATAGTEGERAFEEVFSEFKSNFLDGFHRTVYYFDKNDIRFYMLNSNHPGEDHMISDTQLSWIKDNSDGSKSRNLYFFHEPVYPTGAHVGSSLDVNRLQRSRLWQTIDNSQGPMAFCGHEHYYTRKHIDSDFNETVEGEAFKFNKLVYQVTTGTFGAPIYKGFKRKKNVDVPPVSEFHFAVVDAGRDKIQVVVYNLDGDVIDYFEQ